MNTQSKVDIRPLAPADYPDAARIYFCAIHEGTRGVYTLEQRRAWGGDTINLDRWKARFAQITGFMAEVHGEPVGFMTIDETGYIDLAFVLPSVAGKGVGGTLLKAVERWASTQAAPRLTTHASMAARPFFAAHGWATQDAEEIERQGVTLTRYKMRKGLSTQGQETDQ